MEVLNEPSYNIRQTQPNGQEVQELLQEPRPSRNVVYRLGTLPGISRRHGTKRGDTLLAGRGVEEIRDARRTGLEVAQRPVIRSALCGSNIQGCQ